MSILIKDYDEFVFYERSLYQFENIFEGLIVYVTYEQFSKHLSNFLYRLYKNK